MAISKTDNRLTIHCGENTGYEDALHRIEAIMSLVMAADRSLVTSDDIYYAGVMVLDLLPSAADFIRLEKLPVKQD